ncbi:hypothetical protein SCB49_02934 [unidentified eubacterium SCB49]|nr:hypothetical protein SCB49_02934 [unidentified eubacterium SCB49]
MKVGVKELLIGLITGLLVNALGVLICLFIVSQIKGLTLAYAFNFYIESGTSWSVLTLGALPNLLAFFGFLKINRDQRARGVILATLLTAITAYIIYFT